MAVSLGPIGVPRWLSAAFNFDGGINSTGVPGQNCIQPGNKGVHKTFVLRGCFFANLTIAHFCIGDGGDDDAVFMLDFLFQALQQGCGLLTHDE